MSNNEVGYNGNPHLKKPGKKLEWTEELIEEYKKCRDDPIYFAEKYIKIVHVDHGVIPIRLYDYQKEIIMKSLLNRRVTVCTSRQAGKCVEKDTLINIRNKKTNEILQITIGEFFEMQRKINSKDANNEILKEK